MEKIVKIEVMEFMNKNSYSDPDRSINVLINMSEHQFYENIVFTNENRLETILEFLEKLKLKFHIYSDQITRVEIIKYY
jgi:hypothetical protein